MRFKGYLLNEGRSEAIDYDTAWEMVKKYCKNAYSAYNKGTYIYRGVNRLEDALIVDPSKYTRVSANTDNYYTLINDNSPYWKEYPKRSKSIICTTTRGYANSFGYVFKVFPYDGSKIGVCSSSDYWDSFENSIGYDINMDGFNQSINKIARKLNVPFDRDSITFNNLKLVFNTIDSSLKEKIDSFKEDGDEYFRIFMRDTDSNWMKGYKPGSGKLLEYIQKLFSPNKNGFKLKKAGDKLPRDREVWTDGKSILINDN